MGRCKCRAVEAEESHSAYGLPSTLRWLSFALFLVFTLLWCLSFPCWQVTHLIISELLFPFQIFFLRFRVALGTRLPIWYDYIKEEWKRPVRGHVSIAVTSSALTITRRLSFSSYSIYVDGLVVFKECKYKCWPSLQIQLNI